MLHAAKISLTEMRNSILGYGLITSILYIAFMLSMKMLNLLHLTELRFINYAILCLVCMYQIKHWINKTGAFVPFLQVFFTALFTGIVSSAFFSIFLFIYARFDSDMSELFIQHTRGMFGHWAAMIILFEGTAVSIIIALINVQYFRRFEEGEALNKNDEIVHK